MRERLRILGTGKSQESGLRVEEFRKTGQSRLETILNFKI